MVLPESFSGEGSWTDWNDHFSNVAIINGWGDDEKLLWLRVKLIGRAQAAYKRLSEETRVSYGESVKALQQRFEPESKRELYTVQFQVRHKKTDEGWADFGDALLTLAELAFPEFSSEARERLALNNYLTQLHGKPQLAMAVRQQRPKTVDDAVRATLEVESYGAVAPTGTKYAASPVTTTVPEDPVIAAVRGFQSKQEDMGKLVQKLTDRLEKLESRERGSDYHVHGAAQVLLSDGVVMQAALVSIGSAGFVEKEDTSLAAVPTVARVRETPNPRRCESSVRG